MLGIRGALVIAAVAISAAAGVWIAHAPWEIGIAVGIAAGVPTGVAAYHADHWQ
jgi:hypothetical protein